MNDYIKLALKLVWGIVLIYWVFMAIRSKKADHLESIHKRFIFYWFPLIFAMFLLGPGEWFGHTLIRENFVPHTNLIGITGLIICITGAIIACWSRYLLGKNWSLSVQKKENHELISKGAYKVIRHPIYTGLLILFIGNAVIVGDWRGLIAVAIMFTSFWLKLRKEEKWLKEVFGNTYMEYMGRTKALIPWVL